MDHGVVIIVINLGLRDVILNPGKINDEDVDNQ